MYISVCNEATVQKIKSKSPVLHHYYSNGDNVEYLKTAKCDKEFAECVSSANTAENVQYDFVSQMNYCPHYLRPV